MENKYLKIGVQIELLTKEERTKILSILKKNNQSVDSQTEIFNPPKDLTYFAQYGKKHMWGAISNDVLFTNVKILKPHNFFDTLKKGD